MKMSKKNNKYENRKNFILTVIDNVVLFNFNGAFEGVETTKIN